MPPKCTHHFVIDTPDGHPFSEGVCLKCGTLRSFRNSLENEPLYIQGYRTISWEREIKP